MHTPRLAVFAATTGLALAPGCGREEAPQPSQRTQSQTLTQPGTGKEINVNEGFDPLTEVNEISPGQTIFKDGYRVDRYGVDPKKLPGVSLWGLVQICDAKGNLMQHNVYMWGFRPYRDGGESKQSFTSRVDTINYLGNSICRDLEVKKEEVTPPPKRPGVMS
jgi:hypothetical protein